MFDKELVLEVLQQIEGAAQKVVDRFQIIDQPDDFTNTSAGMEKKDTSTSEYNSKNNKRFENLI